MEEKKIRVAITHGDTNGIGYEVIFKAFADPAILELCTPIIYGSPKVAAYHRNVLGIQANFTIINKAEEVRDGKLNLLATFDEEVKVEIGQPTKESGEAAIKALDRAIEDYEKGLYDVLVTLPVCNEAIRQSYSDFSSETEYIQQKAGGGQEALTIALNEYLRVAFCTSQVPVKNISTAITAEHVIRKATDFHRALKRDFRISNPRIAVLTLNPVMAGATQTEGEEAAAIIPAIQKLEEAGIQAYGPYAVGKLFGEGLYDRFDGVLAMYYDQGMAPFQTLDNGEGITYTAALPLVCTTVNHDAGFKIAGKGEADENAFRQALYTAIDIIRNRSNYDEPLANPLKKLYHEKRDESEKVRFAIPKSKNENKNEKKQENKPE